MSLPTGTTVVLQRDAALPNWKKLYCIMLNRAHQRVRDQLCMQLVLLAASARRFCMNNNCIFTTSKGYSLCVQPIFLHLLNSACVSCTAAPMSPFDLKWLWHGNGAHITIALYTHWAEFTLGTRSLMGCDPWWFVNDDSDPYTRCLNEATTSSMGLNPCFQQLLGVSPWSSSQMGTWCMAYGSNNFAFTDIVIL
ncbi:hypothetical protein PR048_011353 [Dryococelus australis]|uniref:Uncharacterized protein n=1 Tax=Dryococelus australis TaxID=614101 RepID=A0ABQ9HLP6_9NEOP|nr:hypothetical protein PR048_011353 [Dryococelus australis]